MERILFARGQENDYTADELYAAFDGVFFTDIRRSRLLLSEKQWHLTPPEERRVVMAEILPGMHGFSYAELLCDFRCGGYRVLGDILCDMDDFYRKQQIQKRLLSKQGDSKDLVQMLRSVRGGDYREELARQCLWTLRWSAGREDYDTDEAVTCALALGKRQFALDVFPAAVLSFARDTEPKPKKRRLFRR